MKSEIFEFDGNTELVVEQMLSNGIFATVATVDLTLAFKHPDDYLKPGYFRVALKAHSDQLNEEPLADAVSTPHSSE